MADTAIEDLWRELSPQVLGAVVRRYGHFDLAEDAVQEALIAAVKQWPRDGRPADPKAWLITVASRRLTDLLRSEQSRQGREEAVARADLAEQHLAPSAERPDSDSDNTLILLFLCCHPSLTPSSQIALTLRAVGGLTTAEIARAFLVPESTMTRRISRAKKTIEDSNVPFGMPKSSDRDERLGVVLHVLYLIFNEGYVVTAGPSLQRVELATEAIRLSRMVHALLPGGEVTGLLALMLLTDARHPARTGPDGALIPMADQDRTLWLGDSIVEGIELLSSVLGREEPGPYQLQAAIAAVHDEAPTAEETDWPQIRALYDVLLRMTDNPVVRLNSAVAVGMTVGPGRALELLDELGSDERMAEDHRLYAVRAHLLEMDGDPLGARRSYLAAAARTTSIPQQRYLNAQVARLA